MNKTILAISLILCLLSTNLTQAESTGFIIPASAYSLTSANGTFTSIADHPGTVKCGESLAANTELKNGFFVNDNDNPFVTHTADKTQNDAGFPLGFTFNLCGKEMTHFAICASGGIHFGAAAQMPQTQSDVWYTGAADFQNLVQLSAWSLTNGQDMVTTIENHAPAMYLIDGETGNQVLTVQYDYAVNGDEWTYQIKAYEATGDIEFIAGDLNTQNVGDTNYRLFFGLIENSNSTVSNDPFKTLNLNFGDNPARKIAFNQAETGNWTTNAVYNPFTGTPVGSNGLPLKTKPQSGYTLRFKAPADCAEKAQKFEDQWYGFNTTSVTKTSFKGKITFYKDIITLDEMVSAGTLVAVLSTSETPDYTLANGTLYLSGDQLGNGRKVILNAKPGYMSYEGKLTGQNPNIEISASGLTQATTYYIHIYAMDYRCMGAPSYSDLCRTFSFQTSIDLPKTLSAGLPTTNSVPVSVQPADGLGVVLLKSPNNNRLNLNGKLKAGDKIGDAEVLLVTTAANTTQMDVPFQAGEGAYILAYSVINPDSETPTYAQDFLNLPVRAAYAGLPVNLTFEGETFTSPTQGEYGRLPFGWSRETEFPAAYRSYAFRLSSVDDIDHTPCLKSGYPGNAEFTWTEWADVVTPAFAMPAGKERIAATFFLSYTQNQMVGEPTQYKPAGTDLMRVEYSVNGGAWVEVLNINGLDDDFPHLNTDGQYPLNVSMSGFASGDIIRLRYSYQSPVTGNNGTINTVIHAVEITEGKLCDKPGGFHALDSLTTDERLTFRWLDNNLPVAQTSLLSYREVEGNGAWRYLRVSTPANATFDTPIEGSISGLKTGTAYYVRVAALCGLNDTSFYTDQLTVRAAYELPYNESMAQTGDKTPFDRGVKTYSGAIGKRLTETTDAQTGWNQNKTSDEFGRANSVSVGDFVSNAWLMTPAVFIRKTGDFTPKSLNFTLSSFDADKNKGVQPNYASTKLHIVASNNGLFTEQSIIKTLPADSLACIDRIFTVDLTDYEGFLQVAFVFECPDGVQNATEENDATERPEPWFLEISQLTIKYDVDVCFPIKNLDYNLGANEVPLTWTASTSAVEYGIFWSVFSSNTYTDTAYTKEPRYMLTGLKDQTRYKVVVVAYCNEDRSLASEPARLAFYTIRGCHTPEDFRVEDISYTGADFVSTSDQSEEGGYLTHRIVYLTPDNSDETLVFIQQSDRLSLRDTLLEATTYTATTQALCEDTYSPMSAPIRFTTLGTPDTSTAVEPMAQLNGLFSVRTQDGQVVIRNLNQLLVRNVSVYNLGGVKLADFRADSRDDLYLPVNARQLLIFVRLQTEQGTVVYKVYLP